MSKDLYETVEKFMSESFGNLKALKKTVYIEDEKEKFHVVTEEVAGKGQKHSLRFCFRLNEHKLSIQNQETNKSAIAKHC